MADEFTEANAASITPEEMQAAIESSGYLLEGRIARVLQERGLWAEPNAFRVDPNDANKTIEVDVIGRTLEWINEENKSTAAVSILVECKNNVQPFAFFVEPQQVAEVNLSRIRCDGFPAFSRNANTQVPELLQDLLGMKEWHHYCHASEIATRFCGFARANEKKKWKAEPMNQYSCSFSNVALMSAVDTDPSIATNLQNIQLQLAYPVAVFQGPIYEVREAMGKITVEKVSHLQLHHFATLNGQMVQAQIDVVTEHAFPALVDKILNEVKTFRDRINALYPRLLNSALDQKRVATQNAARQMFQAHMTPSVTHSSY